MALGSRDCWTIGLAFVVFVALFGDNVAHAQLSAAPAFEVASVKANAPAVYRALEGAGWRSRAADAGLTVEAWPPDGTPPRVDLELRLQGYFLIPCNVYGAPGSYRVSLLANARDLSRALALVARQEQQPRSRGLAGLAERVRRTWS